mmetsp:Transcript_124358/g.398218  ORF Transcript_124358/g.398218 Transcript_124358/m.398218 type:complete len:202 (+) Transcript_124358:408-1013(+)
MGNEPCPTLPIVLADEITLREDVALHFPQSLFEVSLRRLEVRACEIPILLTGEPCSVPPPDKVGFQNQILEEDGASLRHTTLPDESLLVIFLQVVELVAVQVDAPVVEVEPLCVHDRVSGDLVWFAFLLIRVGTEGLVQTLVTAAARPPRHMGGHGYGQGGAGEELGGREECRAPCECRKHEGGRPGRGHGAARHLRECGE